MFSVFLSRTNCANFCNIIKSQGMCAPLMLGMISKIRCASCKRQKFKGCQKPKPSKLGPYQKCRTVKICEPIEEKCMKRYLMPTDPRCHEFCEPNLRYDLTMYQPHDCRKRTYQQTWEECGPVVKRRKRCFALPPEFERRVLKKRLPNAVNCTMESSCSLTQKIANKCPKIALPGCKEARSPPNCKHSRGPSKCRRRQTRYPSYSECERDPTTKPRPVECNCLETVPMCLVWKEFRNRHASVKE